MVERGDIPPMQACCRGLVYRLSCRNLKLGVYDGEGGFIGIRTKFGDRFLFTEYHWDQGEPFGTVREAKSMGVHVPEPIQLTISLGVIDQATRREILWSDERRWRWLDTGKPAEDVKPVQLGNPPLFEFLDGLVA